MRVMLAMLTLALMCIFSSTHVHAECIVTTVLQPNGTHYWCSTDDKETRQQIARRTVDDALKQQGEVIYRVSLPQRKPIPHRFTDTLAAEVELFSHTVNYGDAEHPILYRAVYGDQPRDALIIAERAHRGTLMRMFWGLTAELNWEQRMALDESVTQEYLNIVRTLDQKMNPENWHWNTSNRTSHTDCMWIGSILSCDSDSD